MSIIPNFPQSNSPLLYNPHHTALKSPIASPALERDLFSNWEATPKEISSIRTSTRNRAQSFQNRKQQVNFTKSNTLQSHNNLTKVGKRFTGSIIIENQMDERIDFGYTKKQSIGSFSSDLYTKIEDFLDSEGLDIVQTESFMDGFKQIIKIQVEESAGNKEDGNCEEEADQLMVVRFISSPLVITPDLASSTLQRRRASLKLKRTLSESNTPVLSCQAFASTAPDEDQEEIKEIKSALLIKPKTRITEQCDILSCVESCEERSDAPGTETPIWGHNDHNEVSPRFSSKNNSIIQGFEKLLPLNGIRATISFLPDSTESPAQKSETYLSPQSKWRKISKDSKKNFSARDILKKR